MSSEEMRMELESFVNAGLREGWHGWPLKIGTDRTHTLTESWRATSAGTWRMGGDRRISLGLEDRFTLLTSLC